MTIEREATSEPSGSRGPVVTLGRAGRPMGLRRTLSVRHHSLAMLRRLRWVAAQIGAKDRGSTTPMLLTPADLPGESWRVLDERVWRTSGGEPVVGDERPRAAPTITVWRSFEQPPQQRWLWTQATPFASNDEAVRRLATVPERGIRNLRADVRLTATEEPEPPRIPNVQDSWAREDATAGPRGEGIALCVAWVYRNVLSALACSGSRDSWQWTDAASLATSQTERISQLIGRLGN